MKNLLLLLLIFISSAYALADNEYRCQLTKSHCRDNGGRYGHFVDAKDIFTAEYKCNLEANSSESFFCKVDKVSGSSEGDYDARSYRCQFTDWHCMENGGRYGYYLMAINMEDAEETCKEVALSLGTEYCKITNILD